MFLNRYYKENLKVFKTFISCYNQFESRIIKCIVLKYDKMFLFDLGFKNMTMIEEFNISNIEKHVFIDRFKFNDLFADIFFEFSILRHNVFYFDIWSFFKKVFLYNCFVIGRFLDTFLNGFAIGIYGFICYLPSRNLTLIENDLSSIFVINNINLSTKKLYISQKLIKKIGYRVLFKLSSIIVDISKS